MSESNDIHSSLLNRIWRILITGLGFALFGIGGLFLSFIWFSILHIAIRDPQRRVIATQKTIQLTFKGYLATMRFLGALDYTFHHLEKLQDDTGCLIVANHPSLLDFVLLASVMPRCDCIVKEALLRNFFIRGVIKVAGYIPNAAIDILLPACKARLAQNGMLLIFPEGTRTNPGQAIKLQRGAAQIALRSEADIRIIHIECVPPLLTKRCKWYRPPRVKPTFNIVIQDKIMVKSRVLEKDFSLSIQARHLTQQISDLLNAKTTL